MTPQYMSGDSQLDLMLKSDSVSGDFVWQGQIVLSMLIDLKPS